MSDDENEGRWIFADEAAKLPSMDELLEIIPKFRRRINGAKILSVDFGEPGLLRKFFEESAEEEKYRWFTPPFGAIPMVAPSTIIKLDDGHSNENLFGVDDSNIISTGDKEPAGIDAIDHLKNYKDSQGEYLFDQDDWTCCVCKKELPCYREDKSIVGVAFRREQLGINDTKVYCHDCAEEERYLEDGSWLPDLAEMYKSVRRCADIEDNLLDYNIPGNDMNLYLYARQDTYTEVCEKCQCETRLYESPRWDIYGCTCSPNKGEEKK